MSNPTKDLINTATAIGDGTATDDRDVVLEISGPERRLVIARIQGTTPLITNKISEYSVRKLAGEKIPPEETPNPDQVFESAIYRDSHGRPCFPAAGIRKAMIDSCRSTDEKMTHMRQYFNVEADLIPIRESEPRMKVDTPRNKKAGTLCIAYRAMFALPWSMDIPLCYNRSQIGVKDVLALLALAGFAVGIGCWRPERNGVFGQFEVVSHSEAYS